LRSAIHVSSDTDDDDGLVHSEEEKGVDGDNNGDDGDGDTGATGTSGCCSWVSARRLRQDGGYNDDGMTKKMTQLWECDAGA
jgi:hypothetical protein